MVRWPSFLGWSAVSIFVHVAFFVVVFVLTLPGLDPYERARPDELAITILPTPEPQLDIVEELEPEPEVQPEPEVRPELAPETDVRPAALIQQPFDTTQEPTEGEPTEAGSGVATAVQVPGVTTEPHEPLEDPEAQRQRLSLLLDPTAVARGGFVATGPGPSRPGGPAGRGSVRDRGPTEQEIEARLAGGLRAEAMTKNHTTRTHPELRRQADGSYAYAGHRFQARISPDGEVHFEDRPGIQTNGFSTSGSWDLTDAIMGSAGQDPYRAEREWFMEETEELRHRLEAEHRREEMTRGLRTLRGRLARDWARPDRSVSAKRRRFFSLWDEMAEDDTGRRARAIVIEFIREVLPVGSEDAYSDREIEQLNARRESTERFAPY